jgi:putative ABC transport system permease protein
MGIALVAGRTFDDHDGPHSLQVAIINQTMARQFWPGQDPVGKRFRLSPLGSDNPWLTVVGIAGDAKPMGMAAPGKAEMYFPYQQDPQAWCAPRDLVIHAATGESLTLATAVKAAIWEVDSQQPVSRIQTMDQLIAQELSDQRVGMTLISALAILAMLLAAIGIYGVLSFVVTQRNQEIGIRMALGAKRGRILRGVVGDGAKLVVVGACIGLAISFGMSRLMSTLLFGISARDPLTFLVATGVILFVSIFASYIPARRATKVDPLTALRYE